MLAGFPARTSDGHPGAQCLGDGLRILHALTWFTRQLSRQTPELLKPPDNPAQDSSYLPLRLSQKPSGV